MNKSQKIRKLILEITFFGAFLFMASSVLASLTPSYKTQGIHPFGNVSLAMVKVPVPISPDLEGKKITYTITCTIQKGTLECAESK